MILALMLVIGGLALALGTERVGRHGDRPPPNLEPGQFGSMTPGTPVPTTQVLALHGARSLHVSDGFASIGGSEQTTIDLVRAGDGFASTLTCAMRMTKAVRAKTIPAATIDAFLDAAASHKATPTKEGACTHTDDYPHIRVTVTATPPVTLSVDNCSYQWHADGVTLDDTAGGETAHHDINAAYRAMLAAAGESECYDELRAQKRNPPLEEKRTGPCNPPYTIDRNGAKVWKRECF